MLSRHLVRVTRATAARALALPAKTALRSTSSALNTNFKTLVEMQLRSCEINAKRELFGVRKDDAYHWYTYAQFAEMVNHFRTALALQGIKRDDKVGSMAGNDLVDEERTWGCMYVCFWWVPRPRGSFAPLAGKLPVAIQNKIHQTSELREEGIGGPHILAIKEPVVLYV